MYIAGTHTKRDAYDDITKVPSVLRDAPYYFPTLKHYENSFYGLNKVAPNIANKIYDNLYFDKLDKNDIVIIGITFYERIYDFWKNAGIELKDVNSQQFTKNEINLFKY